MSNMSYCRFTNTRTDLNDCLDALRRDERMSGMEVQAGRNMFVDFLDFLDFCRDYGIIDSYDRELVDHLFCDLKERDSDDDV